MSINLTKQFGFHYGTSWLNIVHYYYLKATTNWEFVSYELVMCLISGHSQNILNTYEPSLLVVNPFYILSLFINIKCIKCRTQIQASQRSVLPESRDCVSKDRSARPAMHVLLPFLKPFWFFPVRFTFIFASSKLLILFKIRLMLIARF